MLSALIFLPIAAGAMIWLLLRSRGHWARIATVGVIVAEFLLALALWTTASTDGFFRREQAAWIPDLGIQYLLAADGISVVLVMLTAFITLISALVAWDRVDNWPVFGALLLWVEGGLMGVFLALDLVLFYVFWEVMLIPMYFMIARWGDRRSVASAFKFMLFTITGSLLMMIALVALFVTHRQQTGFAAFDYFVLTQTPVGGDLGLWLFLGFLVAFAVKIPMFPLHLWVPDTYTEATPATTIMLSGAMANGGAYAIMRFCFPLFPEAAETFAPVGIALGAVGVVYAGLIALVQQDMRRLAAYSSISHMGLVVLGLFAWQQQSLNGAVVLLVAHGLAVAGLFAAISMLQERGYGRSFEAMGGLFRIMPRLGVLLLFFTLSGMGLPGLANFAGEILILVGSFEVSWIWATVAAFGIVASVAYFLRMYERVMLGPLEADESRLDIGHRETATLALLALAVVWVGVYPDSFLSAIEGPIAELMDLKPISLAEFSGAAR